ncbi:Putative DNA-binding protein [hydrothermal vent metagenome]|uniref:DNA-binding protein n=1 Tax=hydrothermal vent metagenome TaxID=652676 RepID=A0A3B0TG62_9ZZZZ
MKSKKLIATKTLIPKESLEQKILLIRGKKVMLDRDLAQLYGVETKQLKRAVKRNLSRFPNHFMFELNTIEHQSLRSHFGTLKTGQHSKYLPYVFTEHDILMLSSVINNEKAIQINIKIMETFIKLREMLASHKDLKYKIESLEKKYDHQFKVVFETIKRLIDPPLEPKEPIGFHANKPIPRIKKRKIKNDN